MVKQFDRRVGTMIKKIKYAIIVMLIIANVMSSSSVNAAEISRVNNVRTREVTKTFKSIKDASLATTKLKYISGYKISWKKQKKPWISMLRSHNGLVFPRSRQSLMIWHSNIPSRRFLTI